MGGNLHSRELFFFDSLSGKLLRAESRSGEVLRDDLRSGEALRNDLRVGDFSFVDDSSTFRFLDEVNSNTFDCKEKKNHHHHSSTGRQSAIQKSD